MWYADPSGLCCPESLHFAKRMCDVFSVMRKKAAVATSGIKLQHHVKSFAAALKNPVSHKQHVGLVKKSASKSEHGDSPLTSSATLPVFQQRNCQPGFQDAADVREGAERAMTTEDEIFRLHGLSPPGKMRKPSGATSSRGVIVISSQKASSSKVSDDTDGEHSNDVDFIATQTSDTSCRITGNDDDDEKAKTSESQKKKSRTARAQHLMVSPIGSTMRR